MNSCTTLQSPLLYLTNSPYRDILVYRYTFVLAGILIINNTYVNYNLLLWFVVLSQLLSEDGDKVTRERLDSLVIACDLAPTRVNLDSLFNDKKSAHIDVFERWILEHPQLASFTVWLLGDVEDCGFTLEGKPDPPSFHQTLANRFSVDEQVVMDLEKSYWALKGSGKFDLETLQSLVQPPLPEDLCQGTYVAHWVGHVICSSWFAIN